MDWKFGQRYNDLGEWNPRLILCDKCGEYQEPEGIELCAKD
jgi:hypothetical protein